MPQMMPLMWMYMMIFSTIMMLILISFLYFFTPPLNLEYLNKNFFLFNIKNKKKNLWNWKW